MDHEFISRTLQLQCGTIQQNAAKHPSPSGIRSGDPILQDFPYKNVKLFYKTLQGRYSTHQISFYSSSENSYGMQTVNHIDNICAPDNNVTQYHWFISA
jgi:hypothetical protein